MLCCVFRRQFGREKAYGRRVTPSPYAFSRPNFVTSIFIIVFFYAFAVPELTVKVKTPDIALIVTRENLTQSSPSTTMAIERVAPGPMKEPPLSLSSSRQRWIPALIALSALLFAATLFWALREMVLLCLYYYDHDD